MSSSLHVHSQFADSQTKSMGLLDKQLDSLSKPSRRLLQWNKPTLSRKKEQAVLQAQVEQVQDILYKIEKVKAEMELQLAEINRLTEVNKAHMDLFCQSERWRDDARDYQEALKDIMSFTLITATDCRKRSKERQSEQRVRSPPSGEYVRIGIECDAMEQDGANMI